LRQSINIINSKIIQLETSLKTDVADNANYIKLTFEKYSQIIYTRYIEALQSNIQRLEVVLFELITVHKITEEDVQKIKVKFTIIKY